ncbi:MAG: hypothetical protein ACXACO_22260 [Promethearchaeota archaeon]
MSKTEFVDLVKSNRKSIVGAIIYISLFVTLVILGSVAFYW